MVGRDFPWRCLLAATWLMMTLSGFAMLTAYQNTPGSRGAIPASWPSAATMPAAGDKPRLLVFVHPRCPCTRATLAGLTTVLEQAPDAADTQLFLIEPPDAPADWARSVLDLPISRFPGVRVAWDRGGVTARLFGVHTSGHVLVYGPGGELHFSGGITASRGQTGPALGRDSVSALLKHTIPLTETAPVFGCPLFTEASACREDQRCR